MKTTKFGKKKFLFGLAVSMVLAMAVGSFALGENQTPASPQEVEAQSAVGATAGAFTVNGGTQGTDYEFTGTSGTDGVLKIHPQSIGTNITISNTGTTTDRIEVTSAATITLAGVNISTISTVAGPALQIQGNATFDVNILLVDDSTNILKTTANNYAGLQKNGSGTLTIGVPDGSIGTGTLKANGGYWGAGIGGGSSGDGSNITISGGVVTATGGECGAGIGGGTQGSGSNITISGGEVTAFGGECGAGIGGGNYGSTSNITITGGVVTATGGWRAAGIGGGTWSNGSNITISGGVVTATGGDQGAGIGDGYSPSTSGSGNSLNGDAVVLATSGDTSKAALEGFDSLLTKGIAFTGLGTAFDDKGHATAFSWDESGTVYSDSVTISQNVEFPANLTIEDGKEITLEAGKTLTIPTGKTLKNDGTITINNTGTINCQGEITTKTDFYLDDGSLYDTGYQTYQTNAGVQKYKNLPNPYQLDPSNGKRLINWYYLNQASQEVAISESVNVLLNEHSFHENSIEQFTVTFSVPTGTTPAAQTVDTGSKATDPQLSWADGTVEGWYKEQSFTNKWNFGTDTVTGNITLYAKFQCTVTFDPNYSGGSEITSQTVVYDNTVPEPDEPTRDGYSFVEWCKDEECTIAWDFENDRVHGDMTLYAKWLGNEHNVIIPTNPDDHGTVTTDPENPKTGDEVIITVTPEEGYEIDGLPIVKTEDGTIIEVIPTGNPNEYKFIMPDSDVTIEVHFVRISEPEVKTGDSFAGIAALAIIGLSTTGAVMLRKRK